MHKYNPRPRPVRRSRPEETGAMSLRFKILFACALLFVFVASLAGSFVLSGGFGGTVPLKEGYQSASENDVTALRVQTPSADSDVSTLRGYFAGAVEFAQQNGFNTLIFEANEGSAVWWRDDIFPVMPEISQQDGFFYKVDPLRILCEEMGNAPLELWVDISPFEADTTQLSGGAVQKALEKSGGAPSAENTDYTSLLVQSLVGVAANYSVSGILLSGFSAGDAPPSDSYTTALETTLKALELGLSQGGRGVSLALSFDAAANSLPMQLLQELTSQKTVQYLLPQTSDAQLLKSYSFEGTGLIATQPQQYDFGLFLFDVHKIKGEVQSYSGTVVASYPQDVANAAEIGILRSTFADVDAPLPGGFTLPSQLAVTWPQQGEVITEATSDTGEVFVMGVSDGAQPLYLDGEEVQNRSAGGLFGVAVSLEAGENTYTFTQGDDSFVLTLTRQYAGDELPEEEPDEGEDAPDEGEDAPDEGEDAPDEGEDEPSEPTESTPQAEPGQAVQVTSPIASVLIDPHNDFAPSLNETLQNGASFVVQDSVQTSRWSSTLGRNETVWAYQMKSGEYVLSTNCTFVDSANAEFSALNAQAEEGGERLLFEGVGTPAAYVSYEDESGLLTLTFYDTVFTLPEGFTSELVSQASVTTEDDATILTLQTQDLWGYLLEYKDGTTSLYLKKPPTIGQDPTLPLEGVSIMLDAGHGAEDRGALGVMGITGPNEKDVNLVLTQVISYRLQQLGATVLMTRQGDTFPTLQERLLAQFEQKPDFFLSVHHNSIALNADRNDVAGIEAYYYHPYNVPSSQNFAQNLLDTLAVATGRTARWEGSAAWSAFYVTRSTVCPSVLFEYGFMANPTELESLLSEEGIYTAALATVDAILQSMPS